MQALPPLHHVITGTSGAPWVTFISGIGNDLTFWEAQADALAANYRILRFDPWGHAGSPPPPADCRFDDVIEGVVALWDQLGIDRSHVIGLGFGGSTALALGLAHAERVSRIIACCCRPRQPDDRREFWRNRREAALTGFEALADATVDRWLSADFRTAHPDVDTRLRTMMKRTTVEGYRAYVDAFIEMDFDGQLEALRVPVSLIAADHDHGGGPVEAMRAMQARIPGATLEVVSGSGHIVNHEAPEAVNALLVRALRS
jgi:3-oxoadipate enol-lactonase